MSSRSTPTAPARAIRARAAGARCCAGAAGSRELSGFEPATTNNRMELRGGDQRARGAQAADDACACYTDSNYLRQGVTTWLPAWKARGWRTADKQPVKNQDLWQRARARARRATGSNGTGSRATAATPTTSAPTSSRVKRSGAGRRRARLRLLERGEDRARRCSSRPGSATSSISSVLTVPSSTTIA